MYFYSRWSTPLFNRLFGAPEKKTTEADLESGSINHKKSSEDLEAPYSLGFYAFKAFTFLICLLGAISIAYSRFVLSAHSANQIIYGLQLGAWTAFVCIFLVDPALLTIIQEMKSGISVERRARLIAFSSVLTALALAADFAVYIYMDKVQNAFVIEEAFQKRIQACRGDGQAIDAQEVKWGNFWQSGIIITGYAAFLGRVIRQNQGLPSQALVSRMNPIAQQFLKLGIFLLLVVPFGVITLVLFIYKGEVNVIVNMVFGLTIPLAAAVFCIFAFSELLFAKWAKAAPRQVAENAIQLDTQKTVGML